MASTVTAAGGSAQLSGISPSALRADVSGSRSFCLLPRSLVTCINWVLPLPSRHIVWFDRFLLLDSKTQLSSSARLADLVLCDVILHLAPWHSDPRGLLTRVPLPSPSWSVHSFNFILHLQTPAPASAQHFPLTWQSFYYFIACTAHALKTLLFYF